MTYDFKSLVYARTSSELHIHTSRNRLFPGGPLWQVGLSYSDGLHIVTDYRIPATHTPHGMVGPTGLEDVARLVLFDLFAPLMNEPDESGIVDQIGSAPLTVGSNRRLIKVADDHLIGRYLERNGRFAFYAEGVLGSLGISGGSPLLDSLQICVDTLSAEF